MSVRRAILYPLATFIFLIKVLTCYAQDASWLKRSWDGRVYLLGTNPQNYRVVLIVDKVKGKNFEGTMRTIQTSDASVHFDTKISGTVHDRQVVINIGTWKVQCNTCKPQTLGYSIESGRFFLKGEAKGCSVECTWIAEFSEEIDKFNGSEKDMLYTLAEEENTPETDTAALVQNIKPLPQDTIASPPEITSSAQRIPVLPPGDITATEQNNALSSAQKPSPSLQKTPSTTIKESTQATKRIAVLPAGKIISTDNNATSQLSEKPPTSLEKNISVSIPNTQPEQRINVLPAGDIVSPGQDTTLQLAQKPPVSLNKNLSVTLPENPQSQPRTAILPSGTIVSSEHNTELPNPQKPVSLPDKNSSLAIKAGTSASIIKPSPVSKDTPSVLPEGYAERKKNLIKTLIVNTDSILLRVYDNGVVDGDIASVIYNDRVVVDKLSLTARALEIKIPVNKSGINTLVFHAHNLGEFPPNTAKLEILYGNKKEELTVSSDLTVSSTIDIEYRQ